MAADGNAPDPYPFTFLTVLVSLELIFLTSFVLISQNHLRCRRIGLPRWTSKINLLAELKMMSVLRTVAAIAAHLGLADECADDDFPELIEQTDVEAIAKTVAEKATTGE
jgi:uncharacterized membrane protein